jgi:hypothetical protein
MLKLGYMVEEDFVRWSFGNKVVWRLLQLKTDQLPMFTPYPT